MGTVHHATVGIVERRTIDIAHPHCSGELRGGANHPGVLVIAGIAQLGATGLGSRGSTTGQWLAAVGGNRLHCADYVSRHSLGDSAVTVIALVLVDHITVAVFYLFHKVGLLVDTVVGQGGQTYGHIQRAAEVLPQGDAVLRVAVILHQGFFVTRN